ncbi:hypothetical protein HERIO_419 [Hepatospora eriocheir]|uniref:Uncharacterized protein n=1 Tax=Hepatospora eriocheir TaxID=1081669 RepID=A0A1X0QD29_9MICR|nr:hypothetical protein HERIO_419 [Hepatospora eriocheir]
MFSLSLFFDIDSISILEFLIDKYSFLKLESSIVSFSNSISLELRNLSIDLSFPFNSLESLINFIFNIEFL